jgi:succinylglutamate desuccinylase
MNYSCRSLRLQNTGVPQNNRSHCDVTLARGFFVDALETDSNLQQVVLVPESVPEALAPPERLLGKLGDPARGATLICVAGLHGNEPSGVIGVERILKTLEGEGPFLKGCLVGLIGNRRALARDSRFLDRDLNRIWRAAEVARVRESNSFDASEDEEMAELDKEIQQVLAEARGQVFLLDLHSTSGPGPPFVVFEDTLPNRAFALEFPVTLVLGIEEELSGTLSDFMAELGVTTVGFEAGQHREEAAADRAEAAIWIALAAAGVVGQKRPEVGRSRRHLDSARDGLPHVVEVRYRHPVVPGDGFRMESGYMSFQHLNGDEKLASDNGGEIRTTEPGRILMPLYQEQGEDGFFIVRTVRPVWLRLSAAVRRLRLERIMHWLPGVVRDPAEAGTFEVDTQVARWHTMKLFHLLGFRRTARDERWLRMSRRRHDT